MVLPILILLGGLVSGIVMFLYTIRRTVEDNDALIPVVNKWWEITLAFTIAINVVGPGMIIGRLWYIARTVKILGKDSIRPYKQIALALMESGALYTVAITAWLAIFLSNSIPALYMGACILPTVVAIVPTLILLRIHTFNSTHDVTTAVDHSHELQCYDYRRGHGRPSSTFTINDSLRSPRHFVRKDGVLSTPSLNASYAEEGSRGCRSPSALRTPTPLRLNAGAEMIEDDEDVVLGSEPRSPPGMRVSDESG